MELCWEKYNAVNMTGKLFFKTFWINIPYVQFYSALVITVQGHISANRSFSCVNKKDSISEMSCGRALQDVKLTCIWNPKESSEPNSNLWSHTWVTGQQHYPKRSKKQVERGKLRTTSCQSKWIVLICDLHPLFSHVRNEQLMLTCKIITAGYLTLWFIDRLKPM